MSQLKKRILILFLMPLIAKSAFVQAIEESSSDIFAIDAEIAFNEAIIQKPAKKVGFWYKKKVILSDIILVSAIFMGLFKIVNYHYWNFTFNRCLESFLMKFDMHFNVCVCQRCEAKRKAAIAAESLEMTAYAKELITSLEESEFKDVFVEHNLGALCVTFEEALPSQEDKNSFYSVLLLLKMKFDEELKGCKGDAKRIEDLKDDLRYKFDRLLPKLQEMTKLF